MVTRPVHPVYLDANTDRMRALCYYLYQLELWLGAQERKMMAYAIHGYINLVSIV